MRKITTTLALTLFVLPSVSFAAALTPQQSSSLIAVVQSSPGTPASAFVSLITAFSNITVNQAASLITVVQASPSTSANVFVNLLTSFTEDTASNNQPAPGSNALSQPLFCTLTSNPTVIQRGSPSSLSWTAANASTLTINQGIGEVMSPMSGALAVNPTDTTTYTGTATGNGSSATCSGIVIVTTPAPTIPSAPETPSAVQSPVMKELTMVIDVSSGVLYDITVIYTEDGERIAGVPITLTVPQDGFIQNMNYENRKIGSATRKTVSARTANDFQAEFSYRIGLTQNPETAGDKTFTATANGITKTVTVK